MRSSYANFSDDGESGSVTESLAAQLNDNLAKISIPQLSSSEQIRLADIVECVATVEKHRRSMDDNAARYLLFLRQHMLRKGQAPSEQVSITWREIVWAFHSGSQDILVDLVSRQFHGKMLWEHARESGLFMWMTDLTALVGLKLYGVDTGNRQADRCAESAIRGHCTQRVHQDRREESYRLQFVLYRTAEEERAGGSLEDGGLESGASYDATLAGEQFSRKQMEDYSFEERLRSTRQTAVW